MGFESPGSVGRRCGSLNADCPQLGFFSLGAKGGSVPLEVSCCQQLLIEGGVINGGAAWLGNSANGNLRVMAG